MTLGLRISEIYHAKFREGEAPAEPDVGGNPAFPWMFGKSEAHKRGVLRFNQRLT
jgi:hypothetical protein